MVITCNHLESSSKQNVNKKLFCDVERRARADGKGDYFRLHRYRYAAIMAHINAPAGARVLEVGTTPGHCTQLLVGAGYRVSGVDLDPMARAALWQQLGVHVCRMHLERDPLPFADATFDRIVFSEVIEHLVYSPLPVLRDMRRVLVPGGRVIITTPNELYLKSRFRALIRLLCWQSLFTEAEFRQQMRLEGDARYVTHSRIYTMDELCWAVEQAGLGVVTRTYSAAWERVGVELPRLAHNPAGVLAKAALLATTLAVPSTRSMLVVVGERL